uniref:Uncharacterized protein n=1 Tax=Ustilago esculenta TaxID=185366 RepID=A0A481SFN4_9BASI|nr:hypothetical protein UEMT_1991 [Ustilago esculenta]
MESNNNSQGAESQQNKPNNKFCKEHIFCNIFKQIFTGAVIKTSHIKSKLCWLTTTYQKEKKKFPLTGAGSLLQDMDPSDPKMHKMMNGQNVANPVALITTPSLDNSDNGVHKPKDESADNKTNPGVHGHGLCLSLIWLTTRLLQALVQS